jgi:penicillin-binding protein 1A
MSRRERQRRRRRHGNGGARILFLGLGIAAATAGILVLGLVGWVVSVATSGPSLDNLKPVNPGSSSIVYAADGSRLGFIQSDVLRTPVLSSEIPQTVKDATIAIEDRRFFDHRGVDFEGLVRAGVKNAMTGETVQGGSTLTMQLVRNLYTEDRVRDGIEGYKRKIREAKLAEDLENEHPGAAGKSWVLTTYLNSIPYGTVGGQEAIGIQAASRVFFNKPAEELKLHEAALLAGLPQAPSEYNPFLDEEAAMRRRNQVLRAMASQGYIEPQTAERAIERPLGVKQSQYYTQRRENFFFDFVRQELIDKYGADVVRKGGLRIHTTLDLDLQREARESMAAILNQDGDPSSAIVSIDPSNGYIHAMASSAKYGQLKFNLAAQGKRQPGSTFKTMVLMTALRRGVDPNATSYVSRPLKFTDPRWGPIDVSTYSNSYIGSANITRATLSSDNSIYMQLDLDLGPENVKQTAKDMGIKSPLEGYPSEGLGGLKVGVSPLEMANAYATIASGGWRNRPIAVTKVVFPDGKTDNLGKPRRHKAFEDGVTYEATKILKQNIQAGTGTAANIGCPAAGKTGTTDNFRDAWFVGFTPKLATSVWVGYPATQIEMRSVHGISVAGGTFPAQIWGRYMKLAKGDDCGDFPEPRQLFHSSPFFGKYATTGVPGSESTEPAPTSPSGAQDFETGGAKAQDEANGGGGTGGGTGGGGTTGGGGGTTGTGTAGGGGGGFDPDLYESPPQGAPQTQPPASNGGGAATGGASPGNR